MADKDKKSTHDGTCTSTEKLIEAKVREISSLSDEEVKTLLRQNGLGHVPFASSVKSFLLKSLAKKLVGSSGNPGSSDSETSGTVEKSQNEKSTSKSKADPNKTHYAICIPGAVNTIIIESDFSEVIKRMKEHKSENPRMLSFHNLEEAVSFSKKTTASQVCDGANIQSMYPNEKAEVESGEVKLFPSLSTPQLNKFRVHLEKGLLDQARECIHTNPRYLIGTGDVPTILKEGPRYNALHASVVAMQLESCKLIMETVSDVTFLMRMYGTEKRAEENSDRLVDLYLNTPDKIANKTPLHLASEKGMVDIVAFLVSFKACIRDFSKHHTMKQQMGSNEEPTNPGPTPAEVACSRYTKADIKEVKKKILELIEGGTCYVPLIKSDTTGPYAKVAEPFSPSSPYKLVNEVQAECQRDLEPSSATDLHLKDFANLRVWAYAGPMSPQEAEEFRREWRSPRAKRSDRGSPSLTSKITDSERGFERYGRELAAARFKSWQEYWPFLDSFANFRSESGLAKLELYLLRQKVLMLVQALWQHAQFIESEPYSYTSELVLVDDTEVKSDNDSFHSAESSDEEVDIRSRSSKGDVTPPMINESLESVGKSSRSSLGSPFSMLWSGLSRIKNYLSPVSKPEPDKKDPTVTLQERKENKSESSSSSSSDHSPVKATQTSTPKPTDQAVNTGLKKKRDKEKPEASSSKQAAKLDNEHDEDHFSVGDGHSDKENDSPKTQDSKEHQILGLPKLEDSSSRNVTESKDSFRKAKESDTSYEEKDTKILDTKPSDLDVSSSKAETDISFHWEYRKSNLADVTPDTSYTESEASSMCSLHRPNDSLSLIAADISSENSDSDDAATGAATSSQTDAAADESFNTKLDNFCAQLENFSIQSPKPTNEDASSDSIIQAPSVHLFYPSRFTAIKKILDSRKDKYDPTNPDSLPVLVLRQAEDANVVLADLYLAANDMSGQNPLLSWGLVMEETTHKEEMKNVWLNGLVVFSKTSDAEKICHSEGDVIVYAKLDGLVDDEKSIWQSSDELMDPLSLRDLYLNQQSVIENNQSYVTLPIRLLRETLIHISDLFICGHVPTKVDGDVYNSLDLATCKTVRGQRSKWPQVNQWLDRMNKREPEYISSLPSPARLLRSEQSGRPPLSPLVTNERKLTDTATSKTRTASPLTSRPGKRGEDTLVRKLFAKDLADQS